MRIAPLFAAFALAASPIALNAQVQTVTPMTDDAPLLTLTVSESVDAAPDMATISAGVQTQAMTAQAALADNNGKMQSVVDTLKKRGIAAKDIQTSGISVEPQYDYNNRNGQPPRFTGYRVSNRVTVRSRDIAKLGELLDALVAAGGNDIQGPNFAIDDNNAQRQAARDKALATAAQQARYYAAKTGFRDVRLVSITEGGSGPGPIVPMAYGRGKAMMAAESAPIEPGEVSTGIALTVQYRLVK